MLGSALDMRLVGAGFFAAALILAMWSTAVVRQRAQTAGLMDVPNVRSSHRAPTPRGGGIAIVLVSLLLSITAAALSLVEWDLVVAYVCGGAPIALVGYLDDRYSLSARLRFGVHLLSCALALYLLGGFQVPGAGIDNVGAQVAANALVVVGWVWLVNLFNFMDGIDGIAVSEALFVAVAGACLVGANASAAGLLALLLIFSGACAGFLRWNWAPASIFMGDVGSGFLGFACGFFALVAAREVATPLAVWLILAGAFLADATTTLLVRIVTRQRWFEAHRSHAYQHLAVRWQSHARVTVAFLLVNILWLLPLAWFAARQAQSAWVVAALALPPLLFAAGWLRAGRLS